jgi:hypothetical protein
MLTKNVKKEEHVVMRDAHRALLYSSKTLELYECSSKTWEMVSSVYGLTKEQEEEYIKMLSHVRSIGVVCDYAPLRHAMLVDGVIPDLHGEYKEEAITEVVSLPPRTVDIVKSVYGEVDGICATCMSVGCTGRAFVVSFDGTTCPSDPSKKCIHACSSGGASLATDEDYEME